MSRPLAAPPWLLALLCLGAALLVLAGVRALREACGFRLAGREVVRWCGSAALPRETDLAGRAAALLAEAGRLEHRLAALPACPGPNPADLPSGKSPPWTGPAPPRAEDGALRDPGDKRVPRAEPGPGPSPAPGAVSGPPVPACAAGEAPGGGVVVVMDGSSSMRRPYDLPAERERALDAGMRAADPARRAAATRAHNALADGPGEKRIDLTRRVLAEVLARAGHRAPLVTFSDACQVRTHAPEAAAAVVQSLRPEGATPLALALRRAGELVPAQDPGPWQIVLVTDGHDTCRGNPCAAARAVKRARPNARIDVVDLSGAADLGCIAEAGGGRLYRGGQRVDLAPLVRAAVAAAPGCAGPAGEARP